MVFAIQSPKGNRRVLACIDNRVGLEVLRFLLSQSGVDIVAVVTHPAKTALFRDEIACLCVERQIPMLDVDCARAEFDERLVPLAPDLLISVYFDYILDARFISLPTIDAINVHPGYLPYNKGFYYYVWAVLDGTPAGVSIHRMALEVDAGDIIVQKRVLIEPDDTGEVIYRKHEDESISLFSGVWPSIAAGTYKLFRQRHGGTRHRIVEAERLFQIDPQERLSVVELLNRIRVCSRAEKGACSVRLDGTNYELRLHLREIPEV